MRQNITLIVISAFMMGCGENPTPPNDNRPLPPPGGSAATANPPASSDKDRNVDNSGVNKRDDKNAQTPLDQGNSESDRTITAAIRKAVMAEKGFSVNAQNVKIITVNSRVTLRGPVETVAERERINELAKGVAGVAVVFNELDVKQAN